MIDYDTFYWYSDIETGNYLLFIAATVSYSHFVIKRTYLQVATPQM